MKRPAISKRVRFEIFKRDKFTCQYCGAHPPDVILEIDHIEAVANGGTNDIDNLVTSCEPCNRGKSAVPLDCIPQSLKDKAAAIAEAEEQLSGYHQVIEARRERQIEQMWRVAEILDGGCSERGFCTRDLRQIGRFIETLGLYDVIGAAEIACDRQLYSVRTRWKYFCGVCWTKIRRANEASNA